METKQLIVFETCISTLIQYLNTFDHSSFINHIVFFLSHVVVNSMISGLVKYNSYKNTTDFFQRRNCFSYVLEKRDIFFHITYFQIGSKKKQGKKKHLVGKDFKTRQ